MAEKDDKLAAYEKWKQERLAEASPLERNFRAHRRQPVPGSSSVYYLAYSADGQLGLGSRADPFLGSRAEVLILDGAFQVRRTIQPVGCQVSGFAFHPRKSLVAVYCHVLASQRSQATNAIRIYDINTGDQVACVENLGSGCFDCDISFVLRGQGIAVTRASEFVSLYDTENGQEIARLTARPLPVSASGRPLERWDYMVSSPDGNRLLCATQKLSEGSGRTYRSWADVVLFDLVSRSEMWRTEVALAGDAKSLTFAPDQAHVIVGDSSSRGLTLLLDRDGKVVQDLCKGYYEGNRGHGSFTPSGQYLAIAGGGGVKLWNWPQRQFLGRLRGSERIEHVESASFSPCGRWLSCVSSGGVLTVWEVLR